MREPPPARGWGHCSVRWLSRHILAGLPEQVDQSNAEQIRDELLALIDGQTLVLVVDMTGTTVCDHTCGNALTSVYHRAMANGVGLRLVGRVDTVLRTLAMCGLDRVVPVYRTLGAALSATEPAESADPPVRSTAAADRSFPVGDKALLTAGQSGPGEPGRPLISGMADRLAGVSDLLEVTATRAGSPIADQLKVAIGELATVIQDARTAGPQHTT
jgi:anti-anti-sigma factor